MSNTCIRLIESIWSIKCRNILHAGAKYAGIFCPRIFCMQVQNMPEYFTLGYFACGCNISRHILHPHVKYAGIFYMWVQNMPLHIFCMRVQNMPEYFTCGCKIFCPRYFACGCKICRNILPRDILHAGAKYGGIFTCGCQIFQEFVPGYRACRCNILQVDVKNIPGCFAFGCKLSRGLHAGVKSI